MFILRMLISSDSSKPGCKNILFLVMWYPMRSTCSMNFMTKYVHPNKICSPNIGRQKSNMCWTHLEKFQICRVARWMGWSKLVTYKGNRRFLQPRLEEIPVLKINVHGNFWASITLEGNTRAPIKEKQKKALALTPFHSHVWSSCAFWLGVSLSFFHYE